MTSIDRILPPGIHDTSVVKLNTGLPITSELAGALPVDGVVCRAPLVNEALQVGYRGLKPPLVNIEVTPIEEGLLVGFPGPTVIEGPAISDDETNGKKHVVRHRTPQITSIKISWDEGQPKTRNTTLGVELVDPDIDALGVEDKVVIVRTIAKVAEAALKKSKR